MKQSADEQMDGGAEESDECDDKNGEQVLLSETGSPLREKAIQGHDQDENDESDSDHREGPLGGSDGFPRRGGSRGGRNVEEKVHGGRSGPWDSFAAARLGNVIEVDRGLKPTAIVFRRYAAG